MLLDANVVSELICKKLEPSVERRAAGLPLESLFFSAASEAELRHGAAIWPADRCRETLVADIASLLRNAFEDRVLPFDSDAGRELACIAARLCSIVRIVPVRRWSDRRDCLRARNDCGTRNVRDFEGTGIETVNSWTAA